jgi:GntR family transcriptional regulator
MLVHIQPADPRPIYIQIMDEVRRARVIGTLQAEDPLPSVRQLAADLRVNPTTVQQAYRELEREGVVYVRRGQGTFATMASIDGVDRRVIADGIAQRALLEAHRSGIRAQDLIDAIRLIESTAEGTTT